MIKFVIPCSGMQDTKIKPVQLFRDWIEKILRQMLVFDTSNAL
jgi:hypothetical protein